MKDIMCPGSGIRHSKVKLFSLALDTFHLSLKYNVLMVGLNR